jgi:hypothetical protein
MKNQVNEQVQARKLKARLRMLQHAQRMSGNVSHSDLPLLRGIPSTFLYLEEALPKNGLAGLRDQPRRPYNIGYRIPPEIVFANPPHSIPGRQDQLVPTVISSNVSRRTSVRWHRSTSELRGASDFARIAAL